MRLRPVVHHLFFLPLVVFLWQADTFLAAQAEEEKSEEPSCTAANGAIGQCYQKSNGVVDHKVQIIPKIKTDHPPSSGDGGTVASNKASAPSHHIHIDSKKEDLATETTSSTTTGTTQQATCQDNHEKCPQWAKHGECNENPTYMLRECQKSCEACDGGALRKQVEESRYQQAQIQSQEQQRCEDANKDCPHWAKRGECQTNSKYMLRHCRKSCNMCANKQDPQKEESAEDRAKREEIEALFHESGQYGVLQRIPKTQKSLSKMTPILHTMLEYMSTTLPTNHPKLYEKMKHKCRNQHDKCLLWASVGECESNPSFMKLQCAPVCQSCEWIDESMRCSGWEEMLEDVVDGEDDDAGKEATTNQIKKRKMFRDAFEPGELGTMFERIADPNGEVAQKYGPVVVHSRPASTSSSAKSLHQSQEEQNPPPEGPWVLSLQSFLTPAECEHLIQLGYNQGYVRSADTGTKKSDGTYTEFVNAGRTSTTAWCRNKCESDTMYQSILEKIHNVTSIPLPNFEHLQFLKYELGQKYNVHHDGIKHHVNRPCGLRLLTFFLYLSDVEEGGGTHFPSLWGGKDGGLTVQPKLGQALLWPSVLEEDLGRVDPRTRHSALPVVRGKKFAANVWVHVRNFKKSYEMGCT